jgi:phosphatidylinositol alpha-1,6-mannosyltransferase
MHEGRHRYLVISELFLPTKGGTAVWFDQVYRRLGGKEIHIVTADVPGAAAHDATQPNSIHRIRLRRHWWLKPESLAMYGKLLAVSLLVGLRHDFDAIHAGRVLPEGLVGWIVARVTRRPLVVYAHGEEITTWRQSGKFRAMKFAYLHADRVIANSEFTRDELLKLGVDLRRIRLIYPGVDIARFRPGLETSDLHGRIGIVPTQKLILSVGRLSRRKGFDQVVRSLPGLMKKGVDVHYAIIGIGEDMEYLARLAHDEGVADRVHLLGHVPTDDLPRWYNACDVFVMPNREINGDTEGFGMVFIEAAACGKPSIAGLAGGTGAAVEHGKTGLRVDGTSLDAIGDALRQVLTNEQQAVALGTAGIQRARTRFSWDRVAELTIEMMETHQT